MKVLEADEAVKLVRSGDTIMASGVGSMLLPERVLKALEDRFVAEGEPRDLTHFDPSPTGAGEGREHNAREGMLKRYIGSWFTRFPALTALIQANKIEGYLLPLGTMHFMVREMARRNPYYLTRVGLHTAFDPRLGGGKLNARTTEDLIKIVDIDGEEWLSYKTFPIDVAIIRGTSADEDGNISQEDEPWCGGVLFQAMAAKNSGGKVIAQVKRVVARGSINPRLVVVPGILVDVVVVDEKQAQSEATPEKDILGLTAIRVPTPPVVVQPLDADKVIGRRAAMELRRGYVINVGNGIGTINAMPVAREERIQEWITVTQEHGSWGGINFGLNCHINPAFVAPYDATFNLYHGGGIDACFLGFAEIDKYGNMNSNMVGSKLAGAGGAPDIAVSASKVVLCGNFTARGPRCVPGDGKLRIVAEGKVKKFVDKVESITFSGREMWRKGQKVIYVTERAVFELGADGPILKEIAPGVDLERDVLGQMEFRPVIAPDLKEMDSRIFREEPMGLWRELGDREQPRPVVPLRRVATPATAPS